MPSLENLIFISCNISTIPTEIGLLSNLHGFYLTEYEPFISANVPTEIGLLSSNLQTLVIESQQPFISEIGMLSNLKTLILNALPQQLLPTEFGNLSSLQYLTIENNVNGSIPTEYCQLQQLLELHMPSIGLTGSLPCTFGSNLTFIELPNNNLTSVPSFWNSSNLQTLDLSFNNISGSLPEFWEFSNPFATISLDHNFFSGTIPSSFNMANAYDLDLSFNSLSGVIPINALPLSGYAYFSNNQFNGIESNINELSTLDLSFNLFTTIPSTLSQMQFNFL